MSATPGRSNGLHAAAYAALVDLDPQLADAVLDLLRDEGIAAYATPATARPAAGIVLPRTDRPLDRVYADAGAAAHARRVLHLRLPGLRAEHESAPRPTATQEDEAWARIIAAYDAPAADPVPRWPASEDVAPEAVEEPASPAEPAAPAKPAETPGEPAEAPAEHFVPPPPPPLPPTDVVTKLSWLGLLGGPVLLVVGLLVGLDLSGWLGAAAVAAFVAGFVTLVARMQDRPDRDDPDDGAVV